MSTIPPSEFWDFSLEVYGRSEVSKLCLELQDHFGADINMVLFASWLGQTGRGSLSVSAWRAMILRLNKWREEVIKPLRKVRHILRHEQLAGKEMKQDVFQCELEAERVEQQVLEREWGASKRPLVTGSARRTEDMIKNLVAYMQAEKIEINSKTAYRIERLVKLISGLLDDRFIHQACCQAMGIQQRLDGSADKLTAS